MDEPLAAGQATAEDVAMLSTVPAWCGRPAVGMVQLFADLDREFGFLGCRGYGFWGVQ